MAIDRRDAVPLAAMITAGATPAFKDAVRRGARKKGLSLAEYVRLAVSERLTADGVRHARPSSTSEAVR